MKKKLFNFVTLALVAATLNLMNLSHAAMPDKIKEQQDFQSAFIAKNLSGKRLFQFSKHNFYHRNAHHIF